MSSKLYKYFCIFFMFCLVDGLTIKAHNIKNGGCKNHCKINSYEINNYKKNSIFNNEKNIIEESNSCLNNSLCRG